MNAASLFAVPRSERPLALAMQKVVGSSPAIRF